MMGQSVLLEISKSRYRRARRWGEMCRTTLCSTVVPTYFEKSYSVIARRGKKIFSKNYRRNLTSVFFPKIQKKRIV